MKIVETDNFGGDYPNEKFVNLPKMSEEGCQIVADSINKVLCNNDHCTRFWKVVEDDYKLIGGFEP